MPKPRVSIVIPTYNRQELVIEAIESVLAQSYRDFEIIVVDDGSTDETSARLEHYSNRIEYRKQKNQGVAAARNTGIRLSQGEFICFLDSDDLWEPRKLETQVAFADAHSEYALLCTEVRGFSIDAVAIGRNKSEMYDIQNGFVVEQLLFGNWIQTSSVMVRRECFDEVGLFDEAVGQFGEDWLLWMRVASKFPVFFIPEPLVSYRYQPGGLTLSRPEEQFRSLMGCLEAMKDFPQFQRKPYLLREAEYRICLGRAWHDRSAQEYDLAIAKLVRARKLRRIPLVPLCLLTRAILEKNFKRKRTPPHKTDSLA